MCVCRPEVKTPFCGRPGCEKPPQLSVERHRRRGGTLRVPFRFLAEMLKLPPNVELVGVRPTVHGFDETAEFMLCGAGLPDECEVEPGVIYPHLLLQWRVESKSETVFDGFTVFK